SCEQTTPSEACWWMRAPAKSFSNSDRVKSTLASTYISCVSCWSPATEGGSVGGVLAAPPMRSPAPRERQIPVLGRLAPTRRDSVRPDRVRISHLLCGKQRPGSPNPSVGYPAGVIGAFPSASRGLSLL